MRTLLEYKISAAIAFMIIFIFIFPTGYFIWKFWQGTIKEIEASTHIETSQNSSQKISESEKKQIDEWIIKNNLNKYGDPIGTIYIGGTPLFDESTGQIIDLYSYILKKHPDRPWRK